MLKTLYPTTLSPPYVLFCSVPIAFFQIQEVGGGEAAAAEKAGNPCQYAF